MGRSFQPVGRDSVPTCTSRQCESAIGRSSKGTTISAV